MGVSKTSPMVGQTISQYRVEEELGRGGMGVVYRAYDLRLRREVAIKLLAAEIANHDHSRERVLAEARATSSLNHPAVVTIYEVKEEDGRVFIVMELLRGRTLRSIVSGAPNDPRSLSRIGAQIADGLAAAHACGLIHGDIKPENVIVLEDGRVKLLDFGPALPSAIAGRRSVAVLPLRLLTPSVEDQYLGVALADAIINRLSASELLLRPTSAVQRYANQPADPFRAGRELNVQTVVEGSIQKFAEKVRVHVQAWNVADGTSCASAKFDSDISELFSLQDKIGEGLSRALGVSALGEPRTLPPVPRVNTAAYQLFLRAAERLSRLNRWDTSTAVEMLESATKLDP